MSRWVPGQPQTYGLVNNPAVDNSAALIALFGVAGSGIKELPRGSFGFAGTLTVPSGVILVGQGSAPNPLAAATRLVALTPASKLEFANGYGGGRDFCVDGAGIATNLFVVKQRIGLFQALDIINAAPGGIAWKCDGTQNSKFVEVNTSACLGDHLVLDGGAASNKFEKCEFATIVSGKAGIKTDSTYRLDQGAVYFYPFGNVFTDCLVEYGTGGDAVYLRAGNNIIFRDCQFVRNQLTAAAAVVRLVVGATVPSQPDDQQPNYHLNACSNMIFDHCLMQGTLGFATGIDAGPNVTLFIGGGTIFSTLHVGINADILAGIWTDGDFQRVTVTTWFTSPNGQTENLALKSHEQRRRRVVRRAAAADFADMFLVDGDAVSRHYTDMQGTHFWGGGAGAADASFGRFIVGTIGTFAGDLVAGALQAGGWNTPHFRIGAHHIWVDSTGDLRIKATAPTSDLDGAVVGSQS